MTSLTPACLWLAALGWVLVALAYGPDLATWLDVTPARLGLLAVCLFLFVGLPVMAYITRPR